MHCGFFIFFGIGLEYFYVRAITQNQQNPQTDDENPPAWYHLPNQGQQPPSLPLLPPDQSPYGPRSSNKPDSSFVPIPSPFEIPKPKTPQELAASQIVNAAQERRQKDFFAKEEDYDEAEADGFDFGHDSNDHHLYWHQHQTRRRKPSYRSSTTESPLKRILSREITNLERYLPLLARKIGNNHTLNGVIQPQSRHKSTTPIFLSSPTPSTRIGKRRKLVTTISTTPFPIRKQKTKCHNCNDEEDYIEDILTTLPTTRRRKLPKTTQPCRSRKFKSTTRIPLQTLETIGTPSTTTLLPFIDYTETPPSSTRWPHKTFAKWTKFTLSSRRINSSERREAAKRIETLRPFTFWPTTKMPKITTPFEQSTTVISTTTQSSILRRVLGIGDRESRPWTHREHKAEVGCPNGEVSPVELAIVWFVDHLKKKTTASTELIEAVKDALARFRSTLNHNRAAAPPGDSSVGSELESTWNELRKGTWIERVFAELAFSDSIGHNPSDGPDAEAAARKVDELWREAMLASALSSIQNADVENQNQKKIRRNPFFHDQRIDLPKRLYDSSKTVETALNCETFPMLCSILQTLKNNDQNSTTSLPQTTIKQKKNF